MATIKQLMEGQEFIDSLLNTLPSHSMTQRRYLPPEIAARLPAEPVQPFRAPPVRVAPVVPAAPVNRPQVDPVAPAQGAAPGPADMGDPGAGTKRTRFEQMYQRMNGSGMSRNAFMANAIQRLEMTQAGATTYMSNAARLYGPWRLG